MCRYACDLQPMLKVLAGHEHIHKLLNIHDTVRFRNSDLESSCTLFFISIPLKTKQIIFIFLIEG